MSFSIIIPSRNVSNLIPCVEAVRKCEPSARIIFVNDNLQTEGTGYDWIDIDQAFVPKWETPAEVSKKMAVYVSGVKPFVFARNINIGIRAAGTDDVILLNDDALLETLGGFTALAKQAAEHPEYGVISAVTNNSGNPRQYKVGNGLREDPRMVCFIAVYITRSTIEKVGMLDEDFVGYGCEDDDYCFRVRRAGLKIGIYDGCFVDHKSLHSSFRGPAAQGGDFRPNLRRFIEKHGVDNWERTREQSDFKELFA